MTARHRVSKMLLRHGRVYPEPSTWTTRHRQWLAAQQFAETASELVFADLIAAVDGLAARKAAIAERLSHLAQDEQRPPSRQRRRASSRTDSSEARQSGRY
jgi:transposase